MKNCITKLQYEEEEKLSAFCFAQAHRIFQAKDQLGILVDTVEELADLMFELELDKLNASRVTDKDINYNDEIISIEKCDLEETVDITVSKDSLFYANGILTKNSFGLPMSLDWFAAIVTNEELMEMGRQMVILLKTRYSNKSNVKNQLIGINFDKMRYYDVETSDSSSEVINKVARNKPSFDKTKDTVASGIPEDITWD